MTSISRRRATTFPAPQTPKSPPVPNQATRSQIHPETPPATPVHLVSDSSELDANATGPTITSFVSEDKDLKDSKEAKEQQAFNRIRNRTTWSMTPPNSVFPPLEGMAKVRPIASMAGMRDRPPSPVPSSPAREAPINEAIKSILVELEKAMSQPTEAPKLSLDSPCIQQIRLTPTSHSLSGTAQAGPANRSFTLNGPLSSHPATTYAGSPPQNSPASSLYCPGSDDPALSALQNIFPSAKHHLLSRLFAILLALNFITSLDRFSPSRPPYGRPSQTSTLPRQSIATAPFSAHSLPTHIPSKARAMLGLQPQPTRNTPSSRPPLPAYWMRQEERGWTKRIGALDRNLREDLRRIVRMCITVRADGGKDGEVEMEVVVRSLVEVARIGQRR